MGADGERKVVVEAGHLQAYPDKEQCLMSGVGRVLQAK